MRVSDISIKNPVFAWMLMAALIIFGAISFSRMGVSQLPDVDFPVINVSVSLEGAAPEIMETTVVDPIENALSTIEGVKSITSSSKTGSANVTAEFVLEKNIDVALQEVQNKIAQAQRLLPRDLDPAVITKTNPDDQPIMWLAMTYESDDLKFMMKFARDFLRDRFTSVPGVGDIFLGGYVDPALRVWVHPEKLPSRNISVNDIIDAIKTEHSELPGGFIEHEKRNWNVRTMGEAKTPEEFRKIIISRRAGLNTVDPTKVVRLGDVADVEEGLDEVRRLSRFNGKPALGLGIKKQRGSNAVAVAKSIRKKLEEIVPLLPPGMNVSVNFDSTRFIEDSVQELNKHLALAVLLTSLVCWIFLGSFSATFNILLSIPTSIVGAFIVLYFSGFTLNTFTLLGLTLAIGIVVDDAIMVLENIFRYNEKGRGQIQSAIVGAREITFAALAASVAVIAIFLPVAFMKGFIGKYFLQFGVTISVAVFLSLIESLTITPMRCAGFVHNTERTTAIGRGFDKMFDWILKRYQQILVWCLDNRWKVLITSVLTVASSFFLLKFVVFEMAPAQDQSIFLVRLQTPVGSSLAYTNQQTLLAEKWMRERPELKQLYAAIGGFSMGIADSNVSMMFVTMKPFKERGIDPKKGKPLTQQEFMQEVRENLSKIPELKVFIQDLSMRGFSSGRGFPIEFVVMGPNWDKLAEISTKIMADMKESKMMVDVDSNYLLGMPEIQILPNRQLASLHGISTQAIGQTVNSLIGGVRVGQYPKDGHRYDIRLQVLKNDTPEKEIEKLTIANSRNNLIPISSVVDKRETKSLQSISRIDRQRAISIFANMAPGVSQAKAMDFVMSSSKKHLEPAYMVDQTGSSKSFKETGASLIFALVMGFVVAYMILAAQFNSYLDPVAILMALPFSFTGAFIALLLFGQSFNMYSMIGLLLLMGIVKKNSILLVEFANTVRDRSGCDARTALIEACPVRLRPILMTSFATVASAVPSAIAFGAGSETTKPMAICLIGGVLVSTFLTLFVVPVTYSLMDRLKRRNTSQINIKKAFAEVGNEGLEA